MTLEVMEEMEERQDKITDAVMDKQSELGRRLTSVERNAIAQTFPLVKW